jgi:hypothetical protein
VSLLPAAAAAGAGGKSKLQQEEHQKSLIPFVLVPAMSSVKMAAIVCLVVSVPAAATTGAGGR